MRTLGLIGILTVGVAATAAAQQPPVGQSTEIPDEYRPPKGMCRIWLKDVPPKQQPAPTDCATAVKKSPPNGRVVFGDTEEKKTKGEVPVTKGEVPVKGYTGKGSTPPVIVPKKPPLPR
jgi:hypothetical protein